MKTSDRIQLVCIFIAAIGGIIIGCVTIHRQNAVPTPEHIDPVVVEHVYKSTCDERMEWEEGCRTVEDYIRQYRRVV